MDINELLITALRATFVYFYLLIIVRISGKPAIGAGRRCAGDHRSLASGQLVGKLQEQGSVVGGKWQAQCYQEYTQHTRSKAGSRVVAPVG